MDIDYSQLLSRKAKLYKPAAIRGLFPLELIPGMISLLAGKPNPKTFPFEAMEIKLKPVPGASSTTPSSVEVKGKDLDIALQYSATAGLPRLVKWLEEFQSSVHKRPNSSEEGWRISLGSGSQDAICKAFEALVNPGDYVLMETPAYPGTIGLTHGIECNLVEVPCDEQGISAKAVDRIMTEWPADKPKPRVLYTIPTGSNPTGLSATEERKIEILKLVKKHNLLLFEDDAYYFLYYGTEKQARSYFTLEPEVNGQTGRVVRFDSFSKILSSGMRLGFITAPKAICDAVDLITANTNLQVASLTQAVALALLEHWGQQGLLEHCQRVADFYKQRKDVFEAAAKKHLTGLATWQTPNAGMFLYLKLNLAPEGQEGDSAELIKTKAVEKGVLAVPGVGFMPSGSKTACVRTSFSLTSDEDADEAFRRLAEVIKEATCAK